uniref:Uncharacterized protein n=1 Tax=Aegilops tauschii subsp. strangulata TaxID=200361 RepID=A0A453JR56_AEGTS
MWLCSSMVLVYRYGIWRQRHMFTHFVGRNGWFVHQLATQSFH